jgi:hypothetical protein
MPGENKAQSALHMGCRYRQAKRLLRAYKREGDAGLIHKGPATLGLHTTCYDALTE